MGAKIKRVNMSAVLFFQPVVHHRMEMVHVHLRIVPLGDARLIGDYNHQIPRLIELANQLRNTLYEHQLLRFVQMARIHIDGTVTIKKCRFPHRV